MGFYSNLNRFERGIIANCNNTPKKGVDLIGLPKTKFQEK